jgi:rhamnose utilization protein RhaD (predicted bifunctional aldolase and dehydrogenase)
LAVNVALEFGDEGFTAAVAYQEAIREIQRQVESGILNETSAARAGEDAKAAFDQTINALKERQQLQQQLAEQERAIDEERLRTLSRADTGPLRFDDIRTSSGASQLAALNREDPALAESVKQTAELRKIREKLAALEALPVDIVGN